ncbi:MAG: hypothetical protein P8N02_11120 [Actinomycetota bacterium]|nr:hypothetical protein [Actinomycetota bacterium]
MPTADHFDQAASALEHSAAAAGELPRPWLALSGQSSVRGGRLGTELIQLGQHSQHACGRAADELYQLAAECRRRAAVCRSVEVAAMAHAAAIQQWSADVSAAAEMGLVELPPRPPAPEQPRWVIRR